jgi:hypothetical protein
VQVAGARQLDVRSEITGHVHRIFVASPEGSAPATGRPVLYVLDGNAAFPVAAFLARNVASRAEVTGDVAPLVVGIGYPGEQDFDVPARMRDYTVGSGKQTASAKDGGADRFLDFIERKLKPLIAQHHHIDLTRQALFGHSFGGLFVVHALVTRPTAFSTYLASSPSIWWRDGLVLKNLPSLAQLPLNRMPRVQISVGSREDEPPQGKRPPEMLALMAKRQMIGPARKLADQLRALPGWSQNIALHELAGEDHGTAWLPALARGMQFFVDQPAPASIPPTP